MFPQKYYDGFDRCFRYIEDSSDALLEKSALYCTAQWICDHFGKKRLSLDDVNIIMKSEELQQIRERFLLDKFSIEGHEYYLCLLCNMIHTCKLYDVRAKLFYLYYIPSAVTNRSIFQELPDDDLLGLIPSLQNGPHSCMMIHLVLALAQEHWGTKEIFDLVEGNVYLQWINTVGDPTVQIDEFIEYWYAVHTLDAEHIMRKRQKVEDAVKVYRKYKAPLSMLLEQYAQANNFEPKELRVANPWKKAQKNLGTVVKESGMTVDEKLFNDAAYLISREAPTEVIHTVFFKKRDDSSMESALLQSEIRRLMPQLQNILIVNPSASFLDEFKSRFKNCELKSSESAKRNVVFAVRDETVAFLYAKQFPNYRFIRIDELPEAQCGYDLLVVLARDNDLPPLWKSLPLCKESGTVILFVPQTTLTDNDVQLFHTMQQYQIYADWILDVPVSLINSEPRKKMVMLARRGKVFEGRKINLLQTAVSQNNNCFTLSKEQLLIPAEALNRGLTLVKLRQLVKESKRIGIFKATKECLIYDFSEEIKICFYWVKVKGKLDRARAYYRNIYRPKEDAERIKGKRPNDIKTEKGLRGKTEAEILVKLEQVAMYDEYYNLIVDDIPVIPDHCLHLALRGCSKIYDIFLAITAVTIHNLSPPSSTRQFLYRSRTIILFLGHFRYLRSKR